ncbi:Exonuclease 1 [Quillaja saponaria]|uniref:Exonuclease 1 n=1 Tax=Quillaja saponaria TaxID=32244 RepID=A0AAD7PUN2_QUISA|nr:Exonuclease 1 [Quillaja saponaria]KAJ7968817.1 Exonuclease 1 [Quillaja saponaria]
MSTSCSDHLKNKVLKRKNSSNGSFQSENLQPLHLHPDSSCQDYGSFQSENLQPNMCQDLPLPDNGYSAPILDKAFSETTHEEEKFGSNISHLGHYAKISEKSMERFVSVISSFRCSSSGSRASGLRTPLKDVRNTRTNRSTAADFSQFAFVPKKRKDWLSSS